MRVAPTQFGDRRRFCLTKRDQLELARDLMHLISILGHSLILLPASIGLIVLLVAAHLQRDALAFALALALCLLGTLIAKLAFEACLWGVSDLRIASPSGHASLSALVYGTLAAL